MPSNLFIPVFYWNSTPRHYVNKSLISVDYDRIVTGSDDGTLCLWSLFHSEEYNIKPLTLSIGNDTSPIVGLDLCLHDLKERLVSVSHSGNVGIWSLTDGVCVFSKSRVLTCHPTLIKILADGEHVAVAGESHVVEVLNINSLKIEHTINCDDWIIAIDWIYKEKDVLLMTISVQKILSLWTLPKDIDSFNSIDIPYQKLNIEINGNIKVASVSPAGKYLMVVSNCECIIYIVDQFQKILNINSQNNDFRNGTWCDDFTFILWTKNSEGYVYQIDHKQSNSIKDSKNSRRRSNKFKKLPIPFSPEEFQPNDLLKSKTKIRKDGILSDILGKKNSHTHFENYSLVGKLCLPELQSYRFISSGCDDGVVYLCTERDGIFLWNLLDNQYDLESICNAKLSDGFKNIQNNGLDNNMVTCSIISEKDLRLIRGYSDGSISISKLPADTSPIFWKAHLSDVTCFILFKGKHRDVLVSGSADMSIKLWDLSYDTPLLLFTFYNHSGGIRSLFIPNFNEYKNYWLNKFFSVSYDNTVGLFQSDGSPHCINTYGPHPSNISLVKWRPDQDYLLVYCEDGYLYVWEIVSGKLDSRFSGLDAKDVLLNAFHLSHETKEGRLKNISDHPLLSVSSHVGKQSLQALIINTKLLTKELTHKLHQEHSSLSQLSKFSRSGLYKACTYLLPWGVNLDLDNYAINALHLRPPNPQVSYGILGYGRNMSILVPTASVGPGRWRISYLMSSYQSLASTAISKFLIDFEEVYHKLEVKKKRELPFDLYTYFSSLLPKEVPEYLNPSLPELASFWQDTTKELMNSARMIFIDSINRLTKEQQSVLAQAWCSALKKSISPKTKSHAVLVLGILGYEYPYALTPEISNLVTIELLDLIDSNNNPKMKVIATELFAQGFKVWNHHSSTNVNHVIQKLFKLSIAIEPKNLSKTAKSALMLIGTSDPPRFIRSISTRFDSLIKSGTSNESSLKVHAQVLYTLHRLIKKNYINFFDELPNVIEAIVKSLHPHIPKLRDYTLKPVTALIQDLVVKYPMISFDKTEQRLGYGTSDGKVIIYDLNSATKIYKINCHESSINALEFSGSGKKFATFSISDSTIKFWKPPTSIFGIVGGTPQCFKCIEIPSTKGKAPTNNKELLDKIKFVWISTKEVKLLRGWETSENAEKLYTV